jgi:hypothetical protein
VSLTTTLLSVASVHISADCRKRLQYLYSAIVLNSIKIEIKRWP